MPAETISHFEADLTRPQPLRVEVDWCLNDIIQFYLRGYLVAHNLPIVEMPVVDIMAICALLTLLPAQHQYKMLLNLINTKWLNTILV